MIRGELQSGERIVPAKLLHEWNIVVPKGWTVTLRPDRFDLARTPLDFDPGTYSAHDYMAYLEKRLMFVVVAAEVFDGGQSLAYLEADGIDWRQDEPPHLYIGDANVDELMSDGDRRELVSEVVALAEREAGR